MKQRASRLPGAARAAGEDAAVDDHRAGRVGDAVAVVGHLGVEGDLAGARVQGEEVRVGGQVVDVVAIDGEVSGAVAEGDVLAQVQGRLAPVVPEHVPGCRVEGLDVVVVVGEVHHAVVDQRLRLLRPVVHRPHPRHLQQVHVVAVDLVERAVGLEVVGPVGHQPVAGVGAPQHLVGDRHERPHLAGDRRALLGAREGREAQDREGDEQVRMGQGSVRHGHLRK